MVDRIIAVAVHDLRKNDEGQYQTIQGNPAVEVTEPVQKLVEDLHNLYSRRASKAYGRFSEDRLNYPTSSTVQNYSDDGDFATLSTTLMTTLQSKAQAKPGSSGGHVFFAHFERDGHQYIMVAIVNDKVGSVLTRTSNVQPVTHLDVDGFRFAGRVNLTGWGEGDARYIGFLKGKGNVADYFKEFLGCDTTVLSRVETSNLVEALQHFASTRNFTTAEKDDFMVRAKDICERESKAKREIDFTTFANELVPGEPEALIEVLGNPDRSLTDGFVPDRRALKGLVSFKGKTPFWSVEFDRRALHEGRISYNAENNSLTLVGVPDNLKLDLERELEDE